MKKITICLFVVFVLALTSCNDEGRFPTNPPTINLKTKTLSGSIGDRMTIRAHIQDDYVLKYAKLVSPPLSMDTTIYISKRHPPAEASKDTIRSQIDFSYQFTIPDNVTSGESYKIKLKAKDVTSKISVAVVTLKVK